MRIAARAILALIAGCSAPRSQPRAAGVEYRVQAEAALESLRVERCDPDCLAYNVSLEDAKRVGRDVILTPDLWLREPFGEATVRFRLAPGLAVSVPWPKDQDRGAYRITPSTFRWKTTMAIGRFEPETIRIGRTELDVAVLDRPTRATRAGLRRWLTEAARAVSELYGELPVDRVQIIVQPVEGEGAIHFGLVHRGGGPTVTFLLSETAEDDALPGEWVAVHELSHFVLPFISRDDAWLYEGITTYYQAILRARSGHISDRDAWQDLHEGFERGKKDALGRRLDEVSENMHRDRNYMRVYWSGAAIALLADLELRKKSSSLDEAIAGFKGCCSQETRVWSAEEILEQFDKTTRTTISSELGSRWITSPNFPDVTNAYRDLGLIVGADQQISFDDRAPLVALRRSITKPRR